MFAGDHLFEQVPVALVVGDTVASGKRISEQKHAALPWGFLR
jgi:hypothetical protein